MQLIKTSQDVRIAVEDLNPGAGKTVFFIHGWPLDHRIFEYQTAMLSSKGWRCISVDLRGFGRSDVTAEGYDYDTLSDDIFRVISVLRPRDITLAGFSMGGAIALRYMARHRGFGVSRLALLAAAAPSFTKRPGFPYGKDRGEITALITQGSADRPKMVFDFGQNFFGSDPSPEFRSWFDGIAFEGSGIGTLAALRSLRDEYMRADMGAVRVPTGIFQGRLDKVCDPMLAEELRKGIAGSMLWYFERSGHAVFYDELELFNRTFEDFLSR